MVARCSRRKLPRPWLCPRRRPPRPRRAAVGRPTGRSSLPPGASARSAARPSCRTSSVRTADGTAGVRLWTSAEASTLGLLPIAVDAMGGDHAPGEIVAGARQAADSLGVPVVLVGDPDLMGDTGGLPVIACREIIDMHEDGAKAVRLKKDSSLVRAAEAVRDGRASAMVSAGNTGATMASALLRMHRLPGVSRPAIATPIPVPGGTPTVLVDAGANAECLAPWLVQFAQMGSVLARARWGIDKPRVGLLSIGEEESKGTPLVKEAHALLVGGALGSAG